MPADLDSLLRAALQLSQDDRARLADSLLSTLEPVDEAGIEEAWATEVEKRSRGIRRGNCDSDTMERRQRISSKAVCYT